MHETKLLNNVQQITLYETKTFSNVGQNNIAKPYWQQWGFLLGDNLHNMIEHGMYFGTESFYSLIRSIGGVWNDSKERPIVCLIKSIEHDEIYWAIPVGNWNHRNYIAQERINKYLNYHISDIRSCFYHVGNTDVRSIFFISDVIPISQKYIEREYLGKYTNKIYVIKNKKLLSELERKLKRILSWENNNPNYFRQHITDIKEYLLNEIEKCNNVG